MQNAKIEERRVKAKDAPVRTKLHKIKNISKRLGVRRYIKSFVGLFCLIAIYIHKKDMLAYEHKSFHYIRDKSISLFHSE